MKTPDVKATGPDEIQVEFCFHVLRFDIMKHGDVLENSIMHFCLNHHHLHRHLCTLKLLGLNTIQCV